MTSNIIPVPAEVETDPGFYDLSHEVCVVALKGLAKEAAQLKTYLQSAGVSVEMVEVRADKDANHICLELVDSCNLESEGYLLTVTQNVITVRATDSRGVFYGIQSLRQLAGLLPGSNGVESIPCMTIRDRPRFSWRGYMLDESRHFFGTEHVKKVLDWMALVKLNRFHWHLTDMPAWRIEIKAYPELTRIGARGSFSNPEAPPQYYSQSEIQTIVAYAQERHITIVPEIDMPGHATAANRAYPEFSGGGSERCPEFTFNPGKEATYSYLETILDEVAGLFPGPWLHFGGDEVHFGNQQWHDNADIQDLMTQHELPDLKAVERYFVERMAGYISSLGKVPVGWDEIVETGVSKETVVMWWRHNLPDLLSRSYEQQRTTVLCPRIPCYFDFVQHDNHECGRRWPEDGFGTIEQLYQYPRQEHLPKDGSLLLGVQGNLWTERVDSVERADFMTFPRLFALAGAAWSHEDRKEMTLFNNSLKQMMQLLERNGITFFNHFEPDASAEVTDAASATDTMQLEEDIQNALFD